MIRQIKSNVEADKVLHIICSPDNMTKNRVDVVDPDEFIQLAILKYKKGKTFAPHKHIFKKPLKRESIAQESWVVLRGSVKAIFYDLDDKVISTEVLNAGDCSITLYGGHNYEILEEDTLVYEFKTGPYLGQEVDKAFIDDQD